MVHDRENLPFGFKAGDHFSSVHARLNDLQRSLTSHRLLLFGKIDNTETALANSLPQLETADDRSGALRDALIGFRAERITAWPGLALVPLMLWLAFSVASIGGLGYAQAVAWVRSPVNSVLLLGCIIAVFYHGLLGLQVVIEDYVHHEGGKLASLVALKFLTLLLGIASALSVLRVAISG